MSALIVARPLVRGEDAGLVSDLSDPGHMSLTLLAFIGCAGWAGWRLWARQPALHVGLIEGILLILVVLFFIGTATAPYYRAAWLASWEWLGLLLTVFLVRQLAVRPDEHRGLIAVLLAGAVALSVHGLYQAVWEIPATYRTMKDPPSEYIDKQLDQRLLLPTPLEKHQLLQRLERLQVHGPFVHPASLAACLALFLPIMVGAAIASRRGDVPGWIQGISITFAGLALVVLLFTRCWSAVAAVGSVGLGMLGLCWPVRRGGLRVGLALFGLLAGAGGYVLVKTGALTPELVRWRDVWPASWRLIQERGLHGVGLSQFAFFYPRYMTETSGANETTPGSAVLELWAEGGLAVLLVFALGIVVFFIAVRRWWSANVRLMAMSRRAAGVNSLYGEGGEPHTHISGTRTRGTSVSPAPSGADSEPQTQISGDLHPPLVTPGLVRTPDLTEVPPVRWEYYLGGMFGIILAFVLRAFGLPAEDLVSEAIAAGLQSIAWFAAVAIYERIAWYQKEQVASMTAGIVSMLLVLLVNAGINFPSVSGLLWITIALVLAIVASRPVEWLSRHQVAYLLALPVLVAAIFCYFTFVFYPPSASAAADRRARYAAEYFHAQAIKAPDERELRDLTGFIQQRILLPVFLADQEDPRNMRLYIRLASWFGELDRLRNQPVSRQGLEWAVKARRLNSEARDGYEVEADIHTRFARSQTAEAENMEKEARIRFTQTSGNALRRAGVPGSVLEKLQPLIGREFKSPEDFLRELNRLLTQDELKRFQDPVMNQAEKEFREAMRMSAGQREKLKRGAAAKRILAKHHFERAAQVLELYLPRDPTNATLRFLIADALYSAGKDKDARKQADEAFHLDRKAGAPRKLTDRQREQLVIWLSRESDR
jgi:hypothetical protein